MKPILFSLIICLLLVQCNASNAELEILEFTPSECSHQYETSTLNQRISFIEHNGKTLRIKISVVENCGFGYYEIVGFAKLEQNKLLLNYKHKAEIEAEEEGMEFVPIVEECDCCFELEYYIHGISKNQYSTILVENKVLKYNPLKFKVRQYDIPLKEINSSDTMNYIDPDGFRQGNWIWHDSIGNLLANYKYLDNQVIKGIRNIYYDDNTLKEKWTWTDKQNLICQKFDLEGMLLEECLGKIEFNGEIIFYRSNQSMEIARAPAIAP